MVIMRQWCVLIGVLTIVIAEKKITKQDVYKSCAKTSPVCDKSIADLLKKSIKDFRDIQKVWCAPPPKNQTKTQLCNSTEKIFGKYCSGVGKGKKECEGKQTHPTTVPRPDPPNKHAGDCKNASSPSKSTKCLNYFKHICLDFANQTKHCDTLWNSIDEVGHVIFLRFLLEKEATKEGKQIEKSLKKLSEYPNGVHTIYHDQLHCTNATIKQNDTVCQYLIGICGKQQEMKGCERVLDSQKVVGTNTVEEATVGGEQKAEEKKEEKGESGDGESLRGTLRTIALIGIVVGALIVSSGILLWFFRKRKRVSSVETTTVQSTNVSANASVQAEPPKELPKSAMIAPVVIVPEKGAAGSTVPNGSTVPTGSTVLSVGSTVPAGTTASKVEEATKSKIAKKTKTEEKSFNDETIWCV